ncbi:MAG: protein kinase [Clostridiales bacterium]|nr:protein kinase [Clostridiales bacterium]
MRMDFCPNCFASGFADGVCAKCGYQTRFEGKVYQRALPPGTVLRQRYYLGRTLGEGGFGITYKAFDYTKQVLCCVKEYAPNEISRRSEKGLSLEVLSESVEPPYRAGLKRFFDETRILSKLENIPSVVDITDVFQENNTAYFVMEYLDGANLQQIVRATRGHLPVQRATDIVLQVAVSMDVIHTKTKIIHRDITPENIFITRRDQVKLIDFGSAKQTQTGMRSGLSVVLKPKFAPPEQYSTEMVQGSFTDVYSLAGTYYYALTGKYIPTAPDRLAGQDYVSLKEMNIGVSAALSDAVDRALALKVNYRTRSMQQFIAEIASGMGTPVIQQSAAKRPPVGRPVVSTAQGRAISQQRPPAPGASTAQKRAVSQQRPSAPGASTAQNRAVSQQRPPAPGIQPAQNRAEAAVSARPVPPRRPAVPPRKPQKMAIPYVAVVQGPEKGKKWNLPVNETLKLGRSRVEANLCVEQPSDISRVHCLITWVRDTERFCIRDLSANGVFYNGKRLKKGIDCFVSPPARFALASSLCVIELGVRYEYR